MKIKGHPCPTCKKEREYGSKQGAKKSKGRNCRACSNSFQLGGPGMAFNKAGEQLCNDCRERPKKFNFRDNVESLKKAIHYLERNK